MSALQYSIVGVGEDANITVFVPGQRPRVAHSSHPNYLDIVDGALEGDESIVELFDVAETVATKFERLDGSTRVTVANGRVYFDGDEVDNTLTKQIVRFLSDGVEDWRPLVRFMEKVMDNPEPHSREQLYGWLGHDFTITDAGNIVGYKGVRTDGRSIHSGKAIRNSELVSGNIPNEPGDIIEMPRSEVAFDPAAACSYGLHVGTYEYAHGFAQGKLLKVLVDPRDVVSVPTDSNAQKMRVCRYRVINTIDAPETVPVVHDDYDDYADFYQDDDEAMWGDGDGYPDSLA